MNKPGSQTDVSRRHFIKSTSLVAAGAAIAPYVITARAQSDLQIKVGLIGCGGRGKGAVENVLEADKNVKIVAVADVFEERAKAAGTQFKVDPANCFSGFDAYKKLLAIGDINYVILATPPGFRPIHFAAAIEAGKNVFMEKPVAVDGPGVRMVIAAGEKADEKGLKVVAGTQRRHQAPYLEAIKRIHDGAIGDVVAMRAYWNQGQIWYNPWNDKVSDMENMLRNWYHYEWLCGDHIVEQHLHNIDVCNWVMNDHPVKAYGMGGRQIPYSFYNAKGHIWDHFAVEFEYKSGARMYSQCRQTSNCADNVSEAVDGTKGRSNPGGSISAAGADWHFEGKSRNPYVQEHIDLIAAIRENVKINEAVRVAHSTLTAIMGRESAYSGKIVTWEEALNSKKSLAPEKYEMGSMPPVVIAMPGTYKFE
jgi:predicted dehydrogenase